jgi:hypothetical protein
VSIFVLDRVEGFEALIGSIMAGQDHKKVQNGNNSQKKNQIFSKKKSAISRKKRFQKNSHK